MSNAFINVNVLSQTSGIQSGVGFCYTEIQMRWIFEFFFIFFLNSRAHNFYSSRLAKQELNTSAAVYLVATWRRYNIA